MSNLKLKFPVFKMKVIFKMKAMVFFDVNYMKVIFY